MSNMKPEIRFGEFADAWEKRKLGSITESFSGGTPSSGNSEYYGGSIPFIRSGEISLNITELFVTEAGLNNSSAKMVKEGDILYALYGATSGEVSISKINGAINQAILAIRSINNDDHYLIAQWLRMQKKRIISTYLQGGQGNLSGSIVKELEITLPINKDEQKLISSLFYTLDNIITLHQRKLNKIKNFKSAYLSKMFPKEGERYPRLRFAGFTDAWEQRKLGELAGRYDNLRIPVTASNRIPGSTPYYGANGIQDYIEGFTHDGEFVLIAEDGANDLNDYPVHYVNGKVWVNNHAHVIQAIEGISDNRFLKYSFKTLNIEPYLVGGSRAKLNANIMMNLIINTPTIKEQEEIGNFFNHLDNLITLHQRELEKLKQLKQAMLQKMFV